MALVDYFLKIDGVPGESGDDKHKGEIDVNAWSWGLQNVGARASGGGGGAGKVQMQDLHFTTKLNKASPKLMLACATGLHIKEATLTARKAGDRPQEFLKVTFTDLLVSEYLDGGGADGIVDQSALRYAKVTQTVGQPTTINVPPRDAGTAVFDRNTKRIDIIRSPEGRPTVVAGTFQTFLARGLAEYDVMSLMPLLTGPLSTGRLTLTVTEARPTVPPIDVVPLSNLGTTAVKTVGAPATGAVFDLALYQPADLQVTALDFSRRGLALGGLTVDPAGTPATANFDLSQIIGRSGIATLGVRIELHGAGTDGDDNEQDGHQDEHEDGEAPNGDDENIQNPNQENNDQGQHRDNGNGHRKRGHSENTQHTHSGDKPRARPSVVGTFFVDLVFSAG